MIRDALTSELKRQGVKLTDEQVKKCVLELKEEMQHGAAPSISQFVTVLKGAICRQDES